MDTPIKRRDVTPAELAHRAKVVYEWRRLANQALGHVAPTEPALNILLFLYISGSANMVVTVSRLYAASMGPGSTAARQIESLERAGLIVRKPHPKDRRKIHVYLTEQGSAALDTLLSAQIVEQM